VRDLYPAAGEAFYAAGNDAESGRARWFFTGFKEELVADADPKVGLISGDPFSQRLGEPKTVKTLHAVAEGSLAGEDEVSEIREFFWLRDEARLMAELAACVNGEDHSRMRGAGQRRGI